MTSSLERGTQADVARALKISPSAVARLAKNRERTGMPTKGEDGLYAIQDVVDWYLGFNPGRGPLSGIRKEAAEAASPSHSPS